MVPTISYTKAVDSLEHTDPEKLRKLLDAVLMIGSDLSLSVLLRQTLQSALELTGAKYAALGVLDQNQHHLEQFITLGLSEEQEGAIGDPPSGKGVLGLLITDQKPLRVHDIAEHRDSAGFPENHPPMHSFIGVPIICNKRTFGNIYLTDKLDGSDFSEQDEAIVVSIAKATGIAVANSLLASELNEHTVSKERERIARDLHDEVIQRLFVVGLSLQGVIRSINEDRIKSRLHESVEQLDSTIKQIRTTIFALDTPKTATATNGARQRFLSLVNEYQSTAEAEVSLRLSGAIDTFLDDKCLESALAFLREALSNSVRHSKASRIGVEVALEDNCLLVLSVEDNGIGLPPNISTGNGIPNMKQRAKDLEGEVTFERPKKGGLLVRFQLPLKV